MGLTCWACHRRVSQTVLDVIAFPTLALFAIEFSVFQSTQKKRFSRAVDLDTAGVEWMSTGCGSYRPPILDGPKRSTDGLRVQVFSSGPDQFRVGDVADPSSQFACKT